MSGCCLKIFSSSLCVCIGFCVKFYDCYLSVNAKQSFGARRMYFSFEFDGTKVKRALLEQGFELLLRGLRLVLALRRLLLLLSPN